jgi:hypothetical protein
VRGEAARSLATIFLASSLSACERVFTSLDQSYARGVLKNKWPNSKRLGLRKSLRGEEIGIWKARESGAQVGWQFSGREICCGRGAA